MESPAPIGTGMLFLTLTSPMGYTVWNRILNKNLCSANFV